MRKLTKRQIDVFCKAHEGWKPEAEYSAISKMFLMKTYADGLMFVMRIGMYAETVGHHPDIELTYGKVNIRLSTHDAGGVTELDTALAEKIDALG